MHLLAADDIVGPAGESSFRQSRQVSNAQFGHLPVQAVLGIGHMQKPAGRIVIQPIPVLRIRTDIDSIVFVGIEDGISGMVFRAMNLADNAFLVSHNTIIDK